MELARNQMVISDGRVKANNPSCFLFSGKGGQFGAEDGFGFMMNHSGDKWYALGLVSTFLLASIFRVLSSDRVTLESSQFL